MLKTIIIFIINLTILSTVHAACPRICVPNSESPVRCVRDVAGVFCARIQECKVIEANCWLRRNNQPALIVTDAIMCRDLTSTIGFCASVTRKPRSIRPNCHNLKCSNRSKRLNCYRSKDSRCQLLTNCQLQRINCERGSANRLEWTDRRRCGGMNAWPGLRKCRAIKLSG